MNDTSPEAAPAAGALQGERHVSEVAGRAPAISQRAGIGAIVAGGAILCGVILLSTKKPNLTPDPAPVLMPRPVVRYEAPPAPPPAPVVLPVPPPPPLPQATAAPSSTQQARPPRLLVYNAASANGASSQRTQGAAPYPHGALDAAGAMPVVLPGNGSAEAMGPDGQAAQAAQADTLPSRLTPTRLTGVSATLLRHQPYLLTMGTLISCVLQTAMDSTLPGFVTCVIPQDVLGKTGLTLLDRGTRVVGEFKGGVRQGVERLFVVWTRAETPQGVVINLDSPATDPLGRSGLSGEVDRHFWQRFGGALLMTTVDGVIQAGVASSAQDGTTTINTGQAQGIIAETLRGTINLPPTVRKHQGELVSIFVARDLDFWTVYRVQATVPPRPASPPSDTP